MSPLLLFVTSALVVAVLRMSFAAWLCGTMTTSSVIACLIYIAFWHSNESDFHIALCTEHGRKDKLNVSWEVLFRQ